MTEAEPVLRMPEHRARVHRYRRAGGTRQEWRCAAGCGFHAAGSTEGDALFNMRQHFDGKTCCALTTGMKATGRFMPPASFQ
jgi:hypothetical protein